MTLGEVNKIKAKEREKFLKALDGLRIGKTLEKDDGMRLSWNDAAEYLDNNIDTIKREWK
ncbi:hypothetical protein IIC44_02450 [Patescibacteria group bacterium]|nr:hypothetical protein [Patescibacteria group bacterium]